MRIRFVFYLFYMFFFGFVNAQNSQIFEGIITYKKETMNDTLFYNYYIKGSKVRIDYVARNGKLLKYKIIDFKSNEYKVVNPSKKLYVQTYINRKTFLKNNNLTIEKTENYKFIHKKKCNQWIIKDKNNNTVVTYWVSYEGYKYYGDLLQILDETEKIYSYFMQIPESIGYIPFISEERSWLRDERMKMTAEKIIHITIDESIFDVPSDYLLFN